MKLTEAQKKQLEEVREWIARLPIGTHRYMGKRYLTFDTLDQILSKFVILDKDQSLIEIKHEVCSDEAEQLARDHYEAGWDNGVNKAYRLGFRRIIPVMEGTNANR